MNYKEYYENQAGGNLNVFRGSPNQRGYGLGGIFSNLFRFIMPLFKTHALPVIKSGAQTITSEAVKTAANIASDLINGRNIKDSAKQHSNEYVDNIKNQALISLQKGGSIKRRKQSKKNKKIKKQKLRSLQDIFD
jgi:hypothetical protein